MGGRQDRLVKVVDPHFQPEHGLDVLAGMLHVLAGCGLQLHQVIEAALDLVPDVLGEAASRSPPRPRRAQDRVGGQRGVQRVHPGQDVCQVD